MHTQQSNTLMTEGPIWKQIITFAFPLFLGNLFQQLYNTADSLIVGNFLGSDALAAVSSSSSLIFLMVGCGAYSRIEGFGFLPVTCFSLALTTFVSQNLGAKQYERAKQGARFGILCSITLAELIGICIYLFSPYLIRMFNRDPEVVAFGVLQARTVTLFYFLLAFSHCIAGITRGAGKATVPHVYDDGLLVHHPGFLYHNRGKNRARHPDRILGVPADMDPELHRVFPVFYESRLGSRI